jgi:hypothetical protein
MGRFEDMVQDDDDFIIAGQREAEPNDALSGAIALELVNVSDQFRRVFNFQLSWIGYIFVERASHPKRQNTTQPIGTWRPTCNPPSLETLLDRWHCALDNSTASQRPAQYWISMLVVHVQLEDSCRRLCRGTSRRIPSLRYRLQRSSTRIYPGPSIRDR